MTRFYIIKKIKYIYDTSDLIQVKYLYIYIYRYIYNRNLIILHTLILVEYT